MSKKVLVAALCILIAAFGFTGCGNSDEATFPTGTITLICPYTAGGGTDLLARAAASNVDFDGQEMMVSNIEGANALTGSYELYNSDPDGYTLGIVAPEAWVGQVLTGALEDDLARELTPVCQLAYDPDVICVKGDSQFQTFDDLVEYAKQKGKDFKIASNTKGGSNEMFCYGLFDLAAGVEFTYVPYDGAAQSRTAVLGGEAECVMQQLPDVLALIQSGDLRCLGVAGDERSPSLPDVPTFKEQGYDAVCGLHRYIWAAPGTDADIVAILAEKIEAAMQTDSAQETLDTLGFSYDFVSDPEQLKQTIEDVFTHLTQWQEVMQKAGY